MARIEKDIERARLELQDRLDVARTQAERNRLGQFATPTALAADILEYARSVLPAEIAVRFLDPAFGTGSFYSALLYAFPSSRIATAAGYEIDPHYGRKAAELWRSTPLKLSIADFTAVTPPDSDGARANLLICNPPYVRHHHIGTDEKRRLRRAVGHASGLTLGGLSGLYCYFLLLSHAWLAEDGLAGWLIPGEFMDVNYGRAVKDYLLTRVTLLRIHRFEPRDAQFGDALVSSAVVWFKKAVPPANHVVEFTYGGSVVKPKMAGHVPANVLREAPKWTKFPMVSDHVGLSHGRPTLSDLFTIKRGVATGDNGFFILTPEEVARHRLPAEFLRPILPSPRYLPSDEIEADAEGSPVGIPRHFLLSCSLPEELARVRYPSLWEYLQSGAEAGVSGRYLCRHRSPWYVQEDRPPAMFLCTYMGRMETRRASHFGSF